MARKNAFYAQSGGVTAVINASACGVLQTAREHSGKIGKVYAGRNGIIGALTEDLIDTSVESEAAIAALKQQTLKLLEGFDLAGLGKNNPDIYSYRQRGSQAGHRESNSLGGRPAFSASTA